MEFPVTVESQDDFDALVKDRLARERAKFADYDQLKTRAEQAESAKAAAEAERDTLTQRASAAEQWKTDREAADALATVRDEVAKAAGVPAAALRGTTKEELQAHAEALKPLLRGPVLPDPGKTPDKSAAGDADERAAVAALFGAGGS